MKKFVSAVFASCALIALVHARGAGEAPAAPADRWAAIGEPRLLTLPAEATGGEAFAVVYVLPGGKAGGGEGLKAALYNEAGKKLAQAAFFAYPLDEEGHGALAAVLAAPSTAAPGAALVKVEEGAAVRAQAPRVIAPRSFASEVIPLDAGNTSLRTVSDPKKTAEAERLWAILSTTGSAVYATGPFVPPLAADTRRSSFFGDRRIFQYATGKSDPAVHAGIDYAVPKGTAVRACARGRVALAGERMVTGNSIIIEHLPGVYSIYYHLENINVKEGAIVDAEELIGLSGSTGLSTGPHLHWEIRASTENADPDAFVARPILDRALILSLLF
ncbi:MAG: M23 family metallopeptidase [Spirochaetaceae bacterium]|jgi:murein DD-endopeptidase MepM/ murein hydrolase activator NlpD|nr:M23 family metallopeptidase [Spirochaetaceae bacterium]